MTKQQAYVLASNEFPTFGFLDAIKDRSMEIYTEAFAEWIDDNGLRRSFKHGKILWFKSKLSEDKYYTTSELITKFEKNKPQH